MNIFGFSITRISKKQREEKDLEIFERCVDGLDKATVLAKRIIQTEPSMLTVQDLANVQEQLESLIDIYNKNIFARPATMFDLTKLIEDMRKTFSNYTRSAVQRSQAMSELERIKNLNKNSDDEYNLFGEIFNSHLKTATEHAYAACMTNLKTAAKEYFMSLNAIRFTITYDITRLATGVDIIKQYHETKGYTVPEKGLEYTVRFKKLSRDEINEQIKSNKEGEDNESDRNGI